MKDIKQTDLFFKLLDSLDNKVAKSILERSFFSEGSIEELSSNDVLEVIGSIKELFVSENDADIIHDIFRNCDNLHYCNIEYGFLLMLSISSLYSEPKNKKGFVYICKSDINLHKIGASKNPEDRVKQLGLGSSIKHELVFTIPTEDMFSLEKKLHNTFKDKRKHSEWFDLNIQDINTIKGMFPWK